MNPRELRIGNLLQDRISKVPYEVTHNTFSSLVLYIEEEKEAPVEPIPLTEEWLIKFRFKKGYNTYYSYLEIWDSLYIVISKYNAIYISESSDINGQALQVGNFEYVHQLQNLYFTLTGKDLELKQPSSGKK